MRRARRGMGDKDGMKMKKRWMGRRQIKIETGRPRRTKEMGGIEDMGEFKKTEEIKKIDRIKEMGQVMIGIQMGGIGEIGGIEKMGVKDQGEKQKIIWRYDKYFACKMG